MCGCDKNGDDIFDKDINFMHNYDDDQFNWGIMIITIFNKLIFCSKQILDNYLNK